MRLIAGTTFSPPGTASAPPEQKSFCTSTTIRTSLFETFIVKLRNTAGMIGWIGGPQKRGFGPGPPLPPDLRFGGIWTALQHFRVELATLVLFLGRNTT